MADIDRMEFKKVWHPAHTDYFIVITARGRRMEYYNGQVYSTRELAEHDAEKYIAHRRKGATVTVESVERPAAYVVTTRLYL